MGRWAVLLRNMMALSMDNRSRNTSSNSTINVAVNPVNGQSKYRNLHNSRNRSWYDVSVIAIWHSSKNTWANCFTSWQLLYLSAIPFLRLQLVYLLATTLLTGENLILCDDYSKLLFKCLHGNRVTFFTLPPLILILTALNTSIRLPYPSLSKSALSGLPNLSKNVKTFFVNL